MKQEQHIRLISRLDIKGERLVKGINLEGLRTLGNAEVYSRFYTEQGIDELLIMDTVASLYGRENLFNFVKKVSHDIFIPITVGGGLRSLDDLREAFLSGADKVALNTAAINAPEILDQAVRDFGSSSIVSSIEAKQVSEGQWLAYCNNGRTNSGKDVVEWVKEVQDRGVGEIFITDIDKDGTGKGFSERLLETISPLCHVPLSISGGGGSKEHCAEAAPFVNAICLAALLHYSVPDDIKQKALSLQNDGGFAPVQYSYRNKNLQPATIREIKAFLAEHKYDMRLEI